LSQIDVKPALKLSDAQLEGITEAIVSGYDIDELTQILRFKWGFVLANQFDVRRGFYFVVADLVDYAQRKGKARELLALVYSQASGNDNLRRAAADCGVSLDEAERKPRPQNLEAMVNSRSRLIDYALFMERAKELGERVCLIETPAKKGTGFLVAPDCVLTNFHVVEEVMTNMALADNVVCRFDVRTDGDNETTPAGKSYKLGGNGVMAKSPYSQSDLTGSGDPGSDELDYAILRLAEPVGAIPNRKPRGWFRPALDRPIVALSDFVVIPQHAEGRALAIAWGSVVGFPAGGNRVRYDTTTLAGSSGSPCFTADLEVVGVHHAAEAKHNPSYNQAVPLWLIARDLEIKGTKLANT
jgi:hypothetical protein